MSTAAQQLYARLTDALGTHDVAWPDRDAIQQAYLAAGAEGATWNDLPEDVRQRIERVEQLPLTSWEDPADAPDELD